jgi:hypothetical protein
MRIPAYYFTLAILLASAALVTAVIWLALSAFLGMGSYIESVLP